MATKPEIPKLAYSIREAAHASSLSKSTLYNYLAAGKLTGRRIGGRLVIPAESLTALLQGEAA